MHSKTCFRQQLAAGDFATVERCGCGAIHLNIGALTLRLCPDSLLTPASPRSASQR